MNTNVDCGEEIIINIRFDVFKNSNNFLKATPLIKDPKEDPFDLLLISTDETFNPSEIANLFKTFPTASHTHTAASRISSTTHSNSNSNSNSIQII